MKLQVEVRDALRRAAASSKALFNFGSLMEVAGVSLIVGLTGVCGHKFSKGVSQKRQYVIFAQKRMDGNGILTKIIGRQRL